MWTKIKNLYNRSIIPRIWMESVLILAVFVTAFLAPEIILPEMAKGGLLSVFFSKLIFVSAGILHAHVSRKIIFPYIKFEREEDWSNNLMIIAWYVVIVMGWTRGG